MEIGVIGSGLMVSYVLDVLKDSNEISINSIFNREKSVDKLLKIQKDFNVKYIYTNIDEFLKSDKFDTVYVAVINSLHYEYTKKALIAGKNVICEKPFTTNFKDSVELATIARKNKLFLFEAVARQYSLDYHNIKKNIKELGQISLIQCNNSQYSRRFDKYLEKEVLPVFDLKYGGGCLYDINIYCIHFVVGIFKKPKSVQYYPNLGFNNVDISGIAILDYGEFKAVCLGAKDSSSPPSNIIQGYKGYIKTDTSYGQSKSTLILRKKKEMKLYEDESVSSLLYEFKIIKNIIDSNNYDLMNEYLNTTLDVMETLEMLRKSAQIKFE
ncbi:MAG: Gfo/Idh/MocA family oxidoreductase [Erysipelotrichaceae bacterium]|nr:Gfo/Idh/MocA family oxidoreductase [Erysipelotrichaceae bacterium]